MSQPKVTVLIPTFNRARLLPECLESVLGQTVPPAQVIVINDGSPDDTREALAPYMDRIEYIEKENGGKATALNLALPRIRGDYIWIMDDDDVALPEALETHLAVLENDPGIGFTYTSGYVGRTRPDGSGIQILWLHPLPEIPDQDFFIRYLQSIFAYHAAMLVRAECYETVGGFDTTLMRCQDYDMTLRIARRFCGKRINKPTIVVRQHSGTGDWKIGESDREKRGAKGRRYEAEVFGRFRKELKLCDYLPDGDTNNTLGPELKRRAYLHRMAVMAQRAMIKEMVEDLQQALSCSAVDAPLSLAERDIVLRSVGYLWQEDLSALRRELAGRQLPTSQVGTEIKVEMARALYWRILRAIRDRRLGRLLDIVRTAGRIVGLRGIPPLLRAKFSKSR